MQFPISSLPWRSWLRLKALSLSVSAFLDLPAASCSFYRWREHSPPRGGGTAPSSERPGAASRLPAGEEPPSSARPPSSPAPRLPVSPCGAHPVRGSPRAGLTPCGAHPVLGSTRRVTAVARGTHPQAGPASMPSRHPCASASFLLPNLKDRVCFSFSHEGCSFRVFLEVTS